MISLELGFDELEIMKNDSIAKADSIQGPVLSVMPIDPKIKPEEKVVTPEVVPKVNPIPPAKPKAVKKKSAKAKPSQAAIDRWKAKVAAQKAADKKKSAKK
jgi:hypothetical protein